MTLSVANTTEAASPMRGLLPLWVGASIYALLLVAGIGQLIRPQAREMYWRGRKIQLDDEPSAAHRLYRAVFRE